MSDVATTNAITETTDGLTIAKILRAKKMLEDNLLSPPEPADHYAMHEDTMKQIAHNFEAVEVSGSPPNNFAGIKILYDSLLKPGLIALRDKNGNTLAMMGGIE